MKLRTPHHDQTKVSRGVLQEMCSRSGERGSCGSCCWKTCLRDCGLPSTMMGGLVMARSWFRHWAMGLQLTRLYSRSARET